MEESKREESILVLEQNSDDLISTGEHLSRQFPSAFVTLVQSLSDYRTILEGRKFDVVILGSELADRSAVELLHELRLKDDEPAVLYVAPTTNVRLMAELYNAGCQKCLVREGPWREELGPAVRSLLRLRRLEEENRKLVAKLTEANILLEEKNQRLDEFSAAIAHDIRGPLGAISMKLDYILGSAPDLGERYQGLLTRALGSTERLLGTVQGMYDLAKLGAAARKMEEVTLSVLVGDVVTDLNFDEALDIKIGIHKLPVVWGSPDLLRRIFINLISNAVKFNDKREILINIGLERIEQRSLGNFAHVFVEDNGPGIAKEDIADIFNMFSRGSASAEKPEGSGIGLAVVRRIVELHHGKINVDSKIGEGTRFVLTLPMDRLDVL